MNKLKIIMTYDKNTGQFDFIGSSRDDEFKKINSTLSELERKYIRFKFKLFFKNKISLLGEKNDNIKK